MVFLALLDEEPAYWSSDDLTALTQFVKERCYSEYGYDREDTRWAWWDAEGAGIPEEAAMAGLQTGCGGVSLQAILRSAIYDEVHGILIEFTLENSEIEKFVTDPQFGRLATLAANRQINPIP